MKFIEFQDKGFEQAISKHFNISANRISEADLLAIEGIMVTNRPRSDFGVAIPIPWSSDSTAFNMVFPNFTFDVSESTNGLWERDLQYFSHIKTLHVYVTTQSLSSLYGFVHLRELYVVDSNNRDWTFISTLISLDKLYVDKALFSDLTPLRDLCLKQKEEYDRLKADPKSNQFDLLFKRGLSCLSLKNCGISDIKPLADCQWVDDLNLSHNEISDISPLRGMLHLYYLTLRYNKISDISVLEHLTGIYLINLRHNQISNIEVFSGLRHGNLSRLFLEDNKIKDYSPLRYLRLVQHDIDQYEKYRRESFQQRIKSSILTSNDIIGTWSDGLSSFVNKKDTIIQFKEDQTGSVSWGDDDFKVVETFNWHINKGCLDLTGIENYTYQEGKLTDTEASDLAVTNVQVRKYNERTAPDGRVSKAIRFNEAIGVVSDDLFYFISM